MDVGRKKLLYQFKASLRAAACGGRPRPASFNVHAWFTATKLPTSVDKEEIDITLLADAATTAARFTLAGALGGVIVTSVVALATSILNHRWARETTERQSSQEWHKELREQRRQAYARYWTTESRYSGELNRLLDAADPDDRSKLDVRSEARSEWVDAYWTVVLLGGELVKKSVQERTRLTNKLAKRIQDRQPNPRDKERQDRRKALTALIQAMRVELGSTEPKQNDAELEPDENAASL
jgi:hypothetical protein